MADSTTTAVSPLRRRLIDDMMLRNLSPATRHVHVFDQPPAQRTYRGRREWEWSRSSCGSWVEGATALCLQQPTLKPVATCE